MFNWKEIKYMVRTKIDVPVHELMTENQWKVKGYVPISEGCGRVLWVNSHCQRQSRYLHMSEVREMTYEERDAIRREKWQARHNRKEKNKLIEEAQAKDKLIEKLKIKNSEIVAAAVKTMLESKRIVFKPGRDIVIDVETTGLADYDEILQLSIIDTEGNILYDKYLKPIYHDRWDEAEIINHITPKDVEKCPTIIEEAYEIMEVLSVARKVIGYNVAFDINKLKQFGLELTPDIPIEDISIDFNRIYGEWDYGRMDYKFQKLITCAAFFDYPWENIKAHNSLGDCKATLYCFKKIKEYYEKQNSR